MTALDHVTDALRWHAEETELLAPCGLPPGEIHRWLSAWARGLDAAPTHKRPRAVLFYLSGPPPAKLPDPNSIVALFSSLAESQTQSKLLRITLDAGIKGAEVVPSAKAREVMGLEWTKGQASQISKLQPTECLVLATGSAISVFVSGAIVLEFADVRGRTFEIAADLYRKQGWNDGELLLRCGEEDLCERSDLGIWRIPDLNLLKPRPELLIEERLAKFLDARLSGYFLLAEEHQWEANGRVDLYVIMSNGLKYAVELKWIGRSLKKTNEYMPNDKITASIGKSWNHALATVMPEAAAIAGLEQMSDYLKSPKVHSGCLAVYDCRPPELRATAPIDPTTWKGSTDHPGWKCRVLVVPVDPRTPSEKGKASVKAAKPTKAKTGMAKPATKKRAARTAKST
jgi:hypothetical protein